ncbi:hypothetical protein [Kitasatospora sp. MY 5-36]|uniref:hypothetical protein n=1 Tax=Kitasatospora sp. MY 5-36 TaxID=1678027 RepID=UPI000671267E|nr:hypothetical protein [Kitasatospora sp. MY 5-36]
MALSFRRSESRPATRTDTPDHVAADGRVWAGPDYDEARANGRRLLAPRTTGSANGFGRSCDLHDDGGPR